MVHVVDHLSVAALEARYEACEDVTSSRHFQTICLLAKGHSTRRSGGDHLVWTAVDRTLLERYNAFGPGGFGDLRRDNGAAATVLKPELLERLARSLARTAARRRRLDERQGRALDGGRTGPGGLRRNAAGRRCRRSAGRSRSRGRATRRRRRRRARRLSKKTRRNRRRGSGAPSRHADRGLRDRRASARPEAGDASGLGADRRAADRAWPSPLRMALCDRLRLPATGECFWYVSNGVSKPFFEALLRAFAEEAGAGRERIIVLVLDNAGWHGEAGSTFPMAFASSSCPPTPPRCSPPNVLDARRRAHRQQAHPYLEALDESSSQIAAPASPIRKPQGPGRIPLVAQNHQPELITRKPYDWTCAANRAVVRVRAAMRRSCPAGLRPLRGRVGDSGCCRGTRGTSWRSLRILS